MKVEHWNLRPVAKGDIHSVGLLAPSGSWLKRQWDISKSLAIETDVIRVLTGNWRVDFPDQFECWDFSRSVSLRDLEWNPSFLVTYTKPAGNFDTSTLPSCFVPFQMKVEFSWPPYPVPMYPLEYKHKPLVLTLAAALRMGSNKDYQPIWVFPEPLRQYAEASEPWKLTGKHWLWGDLEFQLDRNPVWFPSPHTNLPHWHLIEGIGSTLPPDGSIAGAMQSGWWGFVSHMKTLQPDGSLPDATDCPVPLKCPRSDQ